MRLHYPEAALHVPKILLPRADIALDTWAVVACDQHTSEPAYWEEVRRRVQTQPSTLHLIFPEVYLETADRPRVIAAINRRMEEYLESGVLVEQPPGFVLVERRLAGGAVRRGLMVALDLEHYDYRDGAQTLVRTTEGTVLERLPPRLQVRERALLEVPHIMVLIDDPQQTVIEPLCGGGRELLYDAELMLGGGRVRGYRVGAEEDIEQVAANLAALGRGEPPMLYAVGDGNHSLAAARAAWERLKERAGDPGLLAQHPARYALVELVNIHGEGMQFEPIHRVLFGAGPEELMAAMQRFFAHEGFSWRWGAGEDEGEAPGHLIAFASGARRGQVRIERPSLHLEVASLQAFLNEFARRHPRCRLDYIHGEAALEKLVAAGGCTGFYLPALDKRDFFRTIARDGALPRKTFSLGEAGDKRYYVECRRLVP